MRDECYVTRPDDRPTSQENVSPRPAGPRDVSPRPISNPDRPLCPVRVPFGVSGFRAAWLSIRFRPIGQLAARDAARELVRDWSARLQ